MTLQYLRTLQVAIEGGKTFDYDGTKPESITDGRTDGPGLRMTFETQQKDASTPNVARIGVYNLSHESTAPSFYVGKKVTLSAGYASGNSYVLFQGEIRQARNLRENVTDTVLAILATDGDTPRNYALVNRTLAKGHTHLDRVMVAADALKAMGVTIGYIDKDNLTKAKFPRGFACFGMAKDLLRQTCTAAAASWSIQNGTFQVVDNNKPMPGGDVILTSRTGLVGLPVQTIQGIEGVALLNGEIFPTRVVRIDNRSIQQAEIDPSLRGAETNSMLSLYGLSPDGRYKVFVVSHVGDTRGNEFYTKFIGVKLQAGTISPALAQRGINSVYAQQAR